MKQSRVDVPQHFPLSRTLNEENAIIIYLSIHYYSYTIHVGRSSGSVTITCSDIGLRWTRFEDVDNINIKGQDGGAAEDSRRISFRNACKHDRER